ncbi:MAG: NADH-quinone oxidoreductase subunit J [Alphaproteobacteria bacterium]|nr:NADH-quinone oxidoreductase subunit J [Alphaproteobacteria bacterium]
MIITALFYLFSAALIASAIMVVAARNPVHAVLFLVVCFFNAAGLFLLLGAEFLAFMLIIVYAGAVAVLFLFVVMMLDLRKNEAPRTPRKSLGAGLGIGAVLLVQLALMAAAWRSGPSAPAPDIAIGNTQALGRVLYTDYMLPFQTAGLILLVAMIGAVVLALRGGGSSRRQRAADQLARRPEDVLEVRKAETGKGVEI